MVKIALNEARWDGYQHQYSTVTISFTVPTKRVRDKGNLICASKPFLDGLTEFGVIVDDSYQWIDEQYPPVQYEKGVSRTVITIEEPTNG